MCSLTGINFIEKQTISQSQIQRSVSPRHLLSLLVGEFQNI